MKTISFNATMELFYRQWVEILSVFPPVSDLRTREKDVLAYLLYYCYKYKDLPKEIMFKMVFDYDTKTDIRSKLNMSEAVFNNNLSSLRKKSFISGNTIKDWLVIYPENNVFILQYKFNVDE